MSFLRRYALWIVLVTVACTAGGWAVAAGELIQYTTAATVDVEAAVIPGAAPSAPNLATEQQVATSGVVVSSVAPTFGMTPSELSKQLSVTNKAGTNILQIACSMPTAGAAVSCANAVATAYAAYRNDITSPKATQARDPYHVSVVTLAPLPTAKASKRKIELLAVGVIVGLLLGVGTAFLRDRLDDRVRDRADLERCLQAPVVSEIPAPRRGLWRPKADVIHAPASPLAEAYRHLRARISPLIAPADGQGKILLVTGAQPREGRSSVAMNLAAVMAFAGAKVLLVDADLRNPALSDRFRARSRPGLTDLLAGRAKIGDVIMPTDRTRGLSFMAVGTVADRPADLLDPARLRRAFSVLADVVIVDSGPLRLVSEPLALVPASDIVVVVADVRRTRRADVTAAVQEIRAIGSVTIVGVLNRARRRRRGPVRAADLRRAGPTVVTAADPQIREGGPVTSADPASRAPLAGGWNPAPADSDVEPETAPIDANLALGNEEPRLDAEDRDQVPGDEEPVFSEEEPATFTAVKPSQNHASGAAPAASPNGGAANKIQAAKWSPPASS